MLIIFLFSKALNLFKALCKGPPPHKFLFLFFPNQIFHHVINKSVKHIMLLDFEVSIAVGMKLTSTIALECDIIQYDKV
jgi:hypothetical protein